MIAINHGVTNFGHDWYRWWPGPCLTTTTWSCHKNFSQWGRSFLWKLSCHWLKGLRQHQVDVVRQGPWGWFNIKMSSYQYRKSHCGDKTILRPSYLHNGISYTGKMTSLYWIRTLAPLWVESSRGPALVGWTIGLLWPIFFLWNSVAV